MPVGHGARRAAALLLQLRGPALSAPAATTAAHIPSWHGLAGPEHAALLVTTVRAALLPVHHYLPRAAARLLSMCVKAVRFPAGAWPPHHGRAALPRPGQARPGLLRLLPAGGGHRMTCRAGLRGFLRSTQLPSKYTTLPGSHARKRRASSLSKNNPKSAHFCLPVATATLILESLRDFKMYTINRTCSLSPRRRHDPSLRRLVQRAGSR